MKLPLSSLKESRIHVAGHRGMAGSAILRRLAEAGCTQLITRTQKECDLRDRPSVDRLYESERPEVVVLAAAKVGGIWANQTYPADFMRDNLAIALNVVESARAHGVRRLLFLGSSCIYPKHAPQPMPEECLLTSPLEPSNEAYALAKIAGLKLCAHYRHQYGCLYHSVMPTNLYGPGDNYHPENSHVLPALLRRFHEARETKASEVVIWGTGTPRREFLYVEDLADACLFLLLETDPPDWINVGVGEDITIAGLARIIAEITGFEGRIVQDPEKPDGTPRKLLDCGKLAELGWRARTSLQEGLRKTYEAFLQERSTNSMRAV